MRKIYLLFLTISLIALSCRTIQSLSGIKTTQEIPFTATPEATIQQPPGDPNQPGKTATANATQTQTETPEPTETLSQGWNRPNLSEVIASEFWPLEGLSPGRISDWESFAGGEKQPTDEEEKMIEVFLDQWGILYELAQGNYIPANVEIGLFAKEGAGVDGGEFITLYAADPTSLEGGLFKRHFLIARDNEGEAVVLVIAPDIQNLSQRLSQHGEFVEYVDEDGDLVLTADARQLDETSNRQKYLKQLIDENKPEYYYVENSTYPRYKINVPGVESSFYLIEKLTYSQVLLLISTIQLFDRLELADMKPAIFPPGDDVEFIISREPHALAAALALPQGGTPRQGTVVLFSKNIFDNRYDTAASIAHEAAHLWQGVSPDCDQPEARLEREVGDQIVPSGFYSWTAAELVQAAKQAKIGSYHVSLWVLTKFNQTAHAEWVKQVIRTGMANGLPIINCGP